MTGLESNSFDSFGDWVRARRKALRLTQAELAQQVGCALVTVKKIEQDERRPSQQVAKLLARQLLIGQAEQADFLSMAQGRYTPAAHAAAPQLLVPHLPRLSGGLGNAFVQRKPELDRLCRALDAAAQGGGGPLFLVGEAGSGKTTLLAEFARRAHILQTDLLVIGGQCNAQTGPGDPYRPFREMLGMLTGDFEASWLVGELKHEQLLRLWMSIPESMQSILHTGPELVNILIPGAATARRIIPYLPVPADWMERFQALARAGRPSSMEQAQVLEQVTRLLLDIAARQPVLILVDDLQWVDDASLNLLFHLCRRLVGSRVLLVGALRENDPRPVPPGFAEAASIRPLVLEMARQYGDVRINLNFDNPADGRAFVDAVLDREPNTLGAEFRENLFLRTRGHALFTVEILHSLRESGALVQDSAGRWVQNAGETLAPLPARVEAVIEHRLQGLDPAAAELIAAASACGQVFTGEVLAGALGLAPHIVLTALSGDLGRKHRLVQEVGEAWVGANRVTRYQFRHLLFQEYLYARFNPGEQHRLHRALARELEDMRRVALEDAQLVGEDPAAAARDLLDQLGQERLRHAWLGENWEMAAGLAQQLGRQARSHYAMREAIELFERALDGFARQPAAEDESIFSAILDWEEAAFQYRPYHEQLAQLSRAEGIARRRGDQPRLIQALHWSANVYLARGLWTRAGPALEECLALAEATGSEQLSVRPLFYKGLMTGFSDPPAALGWLERALELARKYGDAHIEALALGTRGQVQAELGQFALSGASIAAARQAAARLGSPLTGSDVELLAGWSCLAMGQAEQGLVFGHRSVEMAIATDNMDCLCNGLACVGYGNLELMRLPDAVAAFEQGIERSEASGAMIPRLNGQAGLAMANFMTGHGHAINDLEGVVTNMHLFANEIGAANANTMLGRCYLQAGAPELAQARLEDAVSFYRARGMRPFLVRALGSLAEVLEARGRSEDAVYCQREASELFQALAAGTA